MSRIWLLEIVIADDSYRVVFEFILLRILLSTIYFHGMDILARMSNKREFFYMKHNFTTFHKSV